MSTEATNYSSAEDLRIRHLVQLLRPGDWWYFLPAPALGALLLGLPWLQIMPTISTALCLAFAYGANGVADREHDSQDKNPLPKRLMVPRTYLVVVSLLPLGSVALALWGFTSLWPLASLTAGLFYSVKPFRLKRLPVLGDIFNLFIFLSFLSSAPGAELTLSSVPWLIWIGCQLQMSQMIHCLQDEQEDRDQGLRNTVIWLGNRKSRYILVLLAVISLAAALAVSGMNSRLVLAIGSVGSLAVVAMSWVSRLNMLRLRLIHRLLGLTVLGIVTAVELITL